MLLENCRKWFFIGLNETWQVSQLFYTEAMLGSRDSRGNLRHKSDKKSDKRFTSGWACERSENGVAGDV